MTIFTDFARVEEAPRLLALDVGDLARVIRLSAERELYPDFTPEDLAREILKEAAELVHREFKTTCPKRQDVV